MGTLTDAINQILTDGAQQGAVAFALLSGCLWVWVHLAKQADPNNDWKRALSVLTILLVIGAAYGYGILTNRVAWSDETLFHALKQMPIAFGFMKLIFTGTKPFSNLMARRRVQIETEKRVQQRLETWVPPMPQPPGPTPTWSPPPVDRKDA